MSEFFAVLHGAAGCDHSVSCGTKVVGLSAGNWDQAEERAKEQYAYHGGAKIVLAIQVFEVASRHTMDVAAWARQQAAAEAARETAKDRAELERLAAKLGVTVLDGGSTVREDAADHLRAVFGAIDKESSRG